MGELSWSLLIQLGLFGGEDWRLHLRACSGVVVGHNHLIKSVGCLGWCSVAGGGSGLDTLCVK